MSEQEDSVLSGVSISTGVIPFPSMDSSLLRQNLSALEESPSPSPESMLRPSAPSSEFPVSTDVSTLPFPTSPPISDDGSPNPQLLRKDSTSYSVAEESHITSSSSKLTSSDKLSALPGSLSTSITRNIRSPTISAFTNLSRGYRRSLDAFASLPSFSKAESDSQVLNPSVRGSNHGILERRPTPENSSTGKETPKQRVSFDSDRSSPVMHGVGQAFLRLTRGSDPQTSSRSLANVEHRELNSSSNVQDLGSRSQSPLRSRAASLRMVQDLSSRSQSPPASRATSPLRVLRRWSSGLLGHRVPAEEPFVAVDPFIAHSHFPFCCYTHTHDLERGEGSTLSNAYECDDLIPTESIKSFFGNAQFFILDTFPRQMYLNFLLRLPAMYFSRVAKIFEYAEVSKPDIQRIVHALKRGGTAVSGPGIPSIRRENNNGMNMNTGTWDPNIPAQSTPAQSTPAHIPMATFSPPGSGMRSPGGITGSQPGIAAPAASIAQIPLPFPDEWTPSLVSPALIRFKRSWEDFIDSLMREWKTLNLVSALLASTILTIFQVPQAGDDPVTRTLAFLSLICALMSLSYGCMYIVRFGMMRNMFHATRWAEEAQKTNTSIYWNVWVFLAMPAVWMAWAMILFLSAILSFVWRTGSVSDPSNPPPIGDRAILGPRILITCVFVLGLVDLAMIIKTLKNYGSLEGLTRTLPNAGTEMGNTAQRGGGAPAHGNTTRGQRGATGEKEMRTRNIDAAMEHRGRQKERSSSGTHRRRREEDVGRTGIRDNGRKDGQNSKGLGLGSTVERDLKIDGLP